MQLERCHTVSWWWWCYRFWRRIDLLIVANVSEKCLWRVYTVPKPIRISLWRIMKNGSGLASDPFRVKCDLTHSKFRLLWPYKFADCILRWQLRFNGTFFLGHLPSIKRLLPQHQSEVILANVIENQCHSFSMKLIQRMQICLSLFKHTNFHRNMVNISIHLTPIYYTKHL